MVYIWIIEEKKMRDLKCIEKLRWKQFRLMCEIFLQPQMGLGDFHGLHLDYWRKKKWEMGIVGELNIIWLLKSWLNSNVILLLKSGFLGDEIRKLMGVRFWSIKIDGNSIAIDNIAGNPNNLYWYFSKCKKIDVSSIPIDKNRWKFDSNR